MGRHPACCRVRLVRSSVFVFTGVPGGSPAPFPACRTAGGQKAVQLRFAPIYGGIMPKQKKIIVAGPLRAEVLYSVPDRRQPEQQRAARCRASTEAQRLLNMKHSRIKLEFLLAANFSRKDLFVTLSFSDESLPATRESCRRCIKAFFRDLRAQRRKRDLPALRYVYAIENKHGDGRFHVHIVLDGTGPRDLEDIASLWTFGGADVQRLGSHFWDDNAGTVSFEKLSRYMCKERTDPGLVGAQGWTPSKNLARPAVSSQRVPDSAKLDPPAEAVLLERREEINAFGEFYFLKYAAPPRAAADRARRENRPRPGP